MSTKITAEPIKRLKAKRAEKLLKLINTPENKDLFPMVNIENHLATFLFVRAHNIDTGSRPLPAGINFWNSPDITLLDNNVPIATNRMVAGKSYTINVAVNNTGSLGANSCTVELFLSDPTLSLNLANATRIGQQVISVQSQTRGIAQFQFVADDRFIGHKCFLARAFSFASNDIPQSGDIFDTVADRHIGQHNLSIVKQGGVFSLNLSNVFPVNSTFTIRTRLNTRLITSLKAEKSPITRNFKMVSRPDTTTFVIKRGNSNLSKSAPDSFDFKFLHLEKEMLSLTIPNLRLGTNEVSAYDIEFQHKKNGKNIGGITIIVTS